MELATNQPTLRENWRRGWCRDNNSNKNDNNKNTFLRKYIVPLAMGLMWLKFLVSYEPKRTRRFLCLTDYFIERLIHIYLQNHNLDHSIIRTTGKWRNFGLDFCQKCLHGNRTVCLCYGVNQGLNFTRVMFSFTINVWR